MKTITSYASLALVFALPLSGADQPQTLETLEVQGDEEANFSQAELDQLLAPIALYPDVLLAQILIAATYPLEVVQAHRWLQKNPELEGEAAAEAAVEQGWDPSVAALTAFPTVLERMDEDLGWTQRLGDAFLLQETEVMDTVQNLRNQALAAGQLQSSDKVTVEREADTIVIVPSDPEVIYVPYYSTRVVYGDWRWSHYPPVYWGPPPGYFYPTVGFSWSVGRSFSAGFFHSTFYWPERSVVVFSHTHNIYRPAPRYRPHPRFAEYPRWQHDPRHRRGVDYPRNALLRHNQRLRGMETSLTRPPPPRYVPPPRRQLGDRPVAPPPRRTDFSPPPDRPRDWDRQHARSMARAERPNRSEPNPNIVRERLRERQPNIGERPSLAERSRPRPTMRPNEEGTVRMRARAPDQPTMRPNSPGVRQSVERPRAPRAEATPRQAPRAAPPREAPRAAPPQRASPPPSPKPNFTPPPPPPREPAATPPQSRSEQGSGGRAPAPPRHAR